MPLIDEYEPKVRCWLPDETEGWVGATIVSKQVGGDGSVKLALQLEDESATTFEASAADLESGKTSLPPLRNPQMLETTEDLTTLSYLNEPAVLHTIKARYSQLNIYTFSGIVLIATNPFDRVDNLYTPDVIQTYSGRPRGELDPHLFSIAEDAYRCMIRDERNQTIVVSGESGAGKTVSAKYIMRYFATVDDPDHPRKVGIHGAKSTLSDVEREILATNPIMEAFGNAKTTRNDNSSRFGKYLEIQFNPKLEIVGAKIRTYLLERSRIVFHQATERNYHIFYQLLRGASPEQKEAFGLGDVSEYHYLNQGDPDIAGVDDAADFKATSDALLTVGIDTAKQQNIYQVLAALLHLGNTNIKEGRTTVSVSSEDPELVKACELLGVSAPELSKWFTKKAIKTGTQRILSDLDYKTALVVRDSVAKYVYSTMFDWLVNAVNGKLVGNADDVKSFIGVLDIYGFEHFKTNSFEQFCINYANEKLQQEFNQHVFKLEQEEYKKEEIDWTYIDFSDNQGCIDLIENRMGILSTLDDESRLPAGTDEGFANNLYTNFNKPQQTYFKKPRFGQSAFVVRHYAMDVTYETDGFVEKNRDTVPDEIVEVLNASSNVFLKEIFDFAAASAAQVQAASEASKPKPAARGGASKARKPTLGNIFKNSLVDLMATINSTNAHYIRCIKPNEEKAAWKFDGPMVLSQLRACGVLETIRISSAGFPSRWSYEEFAQRYELLLQSSDRNTTDARKICAAIIKIALPDPDKYQLGKSKIFFRAGMLALLEKKRSQRQASAAVTIQKLVKRQYWRRIYTEAIDSVVAVQALSRAFSARLRAQDMREHKAATKLQSNLRGFKARRNFNNTRSSMQMLQAVIRGRSLRANMYANAQREAATNIQTAIRGYLVRGQFRRNVKSMERLQSVIRRGPAKRELQTRRDERHSVKHFEENQYRLENKVVEMQTSISQFRSENQSLLEKLEALTVAHAALNTTHSGALESHSRALADEHAKYSTATASLTALQTSHDSATKQLEDTRAKVESLQSELAAKDEQLEGLNERIHSLSTELDTTREQLKAAEAEVQAGPRHMQLTGPSHMHQPHSRAMDPNSFTYEQQYPLYSEAAGEDDSEINLEIERMLNDPKGAVRDELLNKVIKKLTIPTLKTTDMPSRKDVLFPANMANLMFSEMWRLGYVEHSEQLIGDVLKTIQGTVQTYSGEKMIPVGAFWMSNVHEIYSFFCLAEANILQNTSLHNDMTQVELKQYERLMSLAKRDAEAVSFNIYHMWMKEIKKMLDKMIIPAVVEAQSIPGFQAEESTRFLSRVFSSTEYKMDDLLLLLSKVHSAMKGFYLDDRYIKQPLFELMQMIGAKGFNDMLMRKNFMTWKRSVQINYNATRVLEWCKAHDVPGELALDRIVQSAKLLQLKKNLDVDVGFIYDICWALSPAQIQKVMNSYTVSDYETPISDKTLAYVAQKVKEDKNPSTQLLMDVRPVSDSGPFEMAPPRILQKIEPYIPRDVDVAQLRILTELTSRASHMNDAQMEHQLQYGDADEYDEGANGAPNGNYPGEPHTSGSFEFDNAPAPEPANANANAKPAANANATIPVAN